MPGSPRLPGTLSAGTDMRTESFNRTEETAVSRAADRWVPLVDEPPPLDWDLEDLFPTAADATAMSILHIGLSQPSYL